jgi:hypothetical protein
MVLSHVHFNRVGIILFLLVLLLLVPKAAGAQTTKVYSNTIGTITDYYVPGAGIFVSDDLALADSADMTQLEIKTFSGGSTPYNVTVTLFSGDPCVGNPSQIPGAFKTFPSVAVGSVQTLTANFGQSIRIPPAVYLKVTFSSPDAGWAVAEAPEMGSSADQICVDQTGGGGNPGFLNLGSLEASMWVEIWADAPTPVLPRSWGLLKETYLDP